MRPKPRLVIVSDSIRRDLHQPLSFFRTVEIIHLWRQANYQDMTTRDFNLVANQRYASPIDLWFKLRALRPDLVQSPEPSAGKRATLNSLAIWLYCRLYRVKYFFPVLENIPLDKKFSSFQARLINWWVGVLADSARAVIYLNQGAKENLERAGVRRSKLHHLMWGNWGVDVGEFSPAKTKHATKKGQPSRPVVLFVGKLSCDKGLPWLVGAMGRVVQEIPRARLRLVGHKDPSYSLPRQTFIEYLGPVKNSRLPEIYRQAQVVVAPSITTQKWSEQVGNVILQAMSCGVPVVASRSGAIPEFVSQGQGVALIEVGQELELAQAIIKFLTDQSYRRLQSKKARQWILAHYSAQSNIQDSLEPFIIDILKQS